MASRVKMLQSPKTRKGRKAQKQTSKAAKLHQLASHSAPSLSRELALGFPARKRVTLKYADSFLMVGTGGAVATQQFRANSCFDPDYTGTGHQPRGFNQWCSSTGPYQMYRVVAARVSIEALGANTDECTQIAAGFSDLATIPTLPSGSATVNIAPNSELRGWKCAVVSGQTGPVTRLQFEAQIADIEGVMAASVLAEDNYAALYNANPADVSFFTVQTQCLSASAANTAVQVEMEFDVIFEQPILLPAS